MTLEAFRQHVADMADIAASESEPHKRKHHGMIGVSEAATAECSKWLACQASKAGAGKL